MRKEIVRRILSRHSEKAAYIDCLTDFLKDCALLVGLDGIREAVDTVTTKEPKMGSEIITAKERLEPYVWEAPKRRGLVVYQRSAVEAMEAHAAAATAALREELAALRIDLSAQRLIANEAIRAGVRVEQERDAARAQLAEAKAWGEAEHRQAEHFCKRAERAEAEVARLRALLEHGSKVLNKYSPDEGSPYAELIEQFDAALAPEPGAAAEPAKARPGMESVADMLKRHGLPEASEEEKRWRLDRETGKCVAPEPAKAPEVDSGE
jgi:hypothetical protein